MTHWAREYFDCGYAQRWGLLPVTDRIRQDAGHLWRRLHLSAGARVVDLGCGYGRYAFALAARGAAVVGVDSAAALLKEAHRVGRELGQSVHWVRGDMRAVPLRSGILDAVVVIDAFGFFESDEENQHVLSEAARLLRSGGRLALKVVNGSPIVADFRSTDREERDGVVVKIQRSLLVEPACMIERLSVSGPRGSGEYERRQRLYRADEMRAATELAGFSAVSMSSDPSGAVAVDPPTSPTLWVVGQRAAVSARVAVESDPAQS